MAAPFLPVFDRYAQVTNGLVVIDNYSAPNQLGPNGVALVTWFMFAGSWEYCYDTPVTSWSSCYASPSTTWSTCYSAPVTSWSLVTFGP